jgi:hypothetical protein
LIHIPFLMPRLVCQERSGHILSHSNGKQYGWQVTRRKMQLENIVGCMIGMAIFNCIRAAMVNNIAGVG